MSKIFTVFGATGNQGGSIIKHVLGNSELSKEYKIRAVTPDPAKPNSKALSDKGCEVVKADLEHADLVKKAIEGSHTVFAVTDYWNLKNPSLKAEFEQGKAVADACKQAGVKHLIWSTLPHVTKMSNGKYKKVEHFDGKAEVEDYIRAQNIPATFIAPGYFMSNLKQANNKQGDQYYLGFPFPTNTQIPMFDCAGDTGKFVEGILLSKEDTKGQVYYETTEYKSPEEIAKIFTEVTGSKCTPVEQTAEQFKQYIPGLMGEELLENMYIIKDYAYYGPTLEKAREHLQKSQKICVQPLTTVKQFIEKNGPW